MPPLVLRAYAKINLELRVRGVRRDGFHELETVFQTIELHDTLVMHRTRGPLAIVCDAPGIPVDGRNLIARAAAALWARLDRRGAPEGVSVHLEKRVPAQAGLGGGSADAAAALIGFARLWDESVDLRTLLDVAAEVGSDVPFLLGRGTAIGRGRGERLVSLPDLEPHWIVLAWPDIGVSTAAAYAWFDADGGAGVPPEPLNERWHLPVGSIRNDLEGPVVRRHPEIGRAKARLLANGARTAGMSGSGAAVFGLFGGRSDAEVAADVLAAGGCRTRLTRTLARGEEADAPSEH
jgi:4-diphosphocytidyl-2-C-methyl-D-erythritol kinase